MKAQRNQRREAAWTLLTRAAVMVALVVGGMGVFVLGWDLFIASYLGLPPITLGEALGFWLLGAFALLPILAAVELLRSR